jgi:hypothetical protein
MNSKEELGIMINSHSGHGRFWKASLSSAKKMDPLFFVFSYNTRFVPDVDQSINVVMPKYNVLNIPDAILVQDLQPNWSAWLWLQQYGLSALLRGPQEFVETPVTVVPKYVFGMNGDCVVDRPEGINTIWEIMEDQNADIVPCGWIGEDNEWANTLSYFSKSKTIMDVINWMCEICFKEGYYIHTVGTEGLFRKGMAECGYKIGKIVNGVCPDHLSFGHRGTWGDILGFRHLHGTEKWRMGNHHKPLPKYYYDPDYFRGEETRALLPYWETGSTDHFIEVGYWTDEPYDTRWKDMYGDPI